MVPHAPQLHPRLEGGADGLLLPQVFEVDVDYVANRSQARPPQQQLMVDQLRRPRRKFSQVHAVITLAR